MRGNTIVLQLDKDRVVHAGSLYQYDYGQRLVLEGVELPSAYEVHFGNAENGTSKSMIGDETGVDIPDEFLTTGKPLHVWLYLHDGESDGETEYHGMIGVIRRAKPTNQEPTPVQQDVITQTIAALDAAVDEAEQIAESIPGKIDEAFGQVSAEAETLAPGSSATATFDAETKTLTIGVPKGDKGDPGTDADPTELINDNAGSGTTDRTWSANKLVSEFSGKMNAALKGNANGVAELDDNGLVPASQLPSYVDDVLEYGDTEDFPETGESGKIYVALSTNKTYRWSGSTYVEISESLALGETSSTAYRGDRGKAAYDAAVVNPDIVPMEGSVNLVRSGGVYSELDLKAPKANPVFTGSISMGRKENTTVGDNSMAVGYNVTASGSYAVAEGFTTRATGAYSHAEGNGASSEYYGAFGKADHAEGYGTIANSGSSSLNFAAHAEGYMTSATSLAAHSEGMSSKASNTAAHAEGYQTGASGQYSHSEGYSTNVNSYGAKGKADHSEGYCTIANSGSASSNYGAHAEGHTTSATNRAAHSEGYSTTASGQDSHSEGSYCVASNVAAHSEGYSTTASGSGSHSEGNGTTASGSESHSEGSGTVASGAFGHSEGYHSVANGTASHSEGCYTTALGFYQHVFGSGNIAERASGSEMIPSDLSEIPDFDPTREKYFYGDIVKIDGTVYVAHNNICFVRRGTPDADIYNWHVVESVQEEPPVWQNGTYAVNSIVKWTDSTGTTKYYTNHNSISNPYIIPGIEDGNRDWHTQPTETSRPVLYSRFVEIVGGGWVYSHANIRSLDWYGNERIAGDLYVGCNFDSTGGTKVATITDIPAVATTLETQAIINEYGVSA